MTDKSFIAELCERAGYHVYKRSSHGPAFDWAPKGPLGSSHFSTRERAQRDMEEHVAAKLDAAGVLIRLSDEIKRERGMLVRK
jgi:hypothetical protein